MIQGKTWALVENPKCASTSMRAALLGFVVDPEKHAPFTSQRIAPGKPFRAVCVRNPFDRIVSGWAYNRRPGVSFLEWLVDPQPWEVGVGLDFKRVPQTAWAWRCNHIMRFERLDEDWPRFCEEAGIGDRPLGRANSRPHAKYRDVICATARALIEDRFAPDFARWEYGW